MNAQTVTDIVRQTLLTACWVGLPLLVVGFVVGVAVSLVQIVTSLQDPAFATVPRLLAFAAAVFLLLPWMTLRLVSFTAGILGNLGRYAQ